VAHAYLFYGPDGVGKRATALAFAQALLCLEGGDTPCNQCNACHKVRRMLHADVHVLLPYPSDTTTEDLTERLRLLGEDPYATIDFVRRPSLTDPNKTSNKQALYTVGRVHEELRRAMSFRPAEGRFKIALIVDCDLMRTEAANAFLKLLEEPGPQTVFILTSSRIDRILPTILSRCQRFRFDPLPVEAIEQALQDRAPRPPGVAGMLARMADGSFSRALALAEHEDLMENRRLVIDFFRFAYARHIDKLSDLIEAMGNGGRERLKGLLNLMLGWLRDLVLYRALGASAPLVNVDQAETIERFCTNVPDADLTSMIYQVEEAIDLIERNVHTLLTLTTLAQVIGQAMHHPDTGPLYVPLVETAVPMAKAPR
jgi:DNA polymerase-3 subunit delta'